MANSFRTTIRVEGIEEAVRKLRKVADAATSRQTLEDALKDSAELVRKRASELAPVGTDPVQRKRLRDGLRIRPAGRMGFFGTKDGVWIQVAPLLEVSHANLQEFGTTHHAPQPFMRPAYDQQEQAVIDLVRKRVADATERAAR